MVELAPDEHVQNVAMGDTAAWQVSLNKAGDRLFLKPTKAEGNTNMTVVTSVRVYAFDLIADGGASVDTPYTVQFRYPVAKAAPSGDYVDVSAIARKLSRYRISGDRLLRPASVSDDGQRTYVSWPKGAPIPAIYVPGTSGSEALANGMMGADDVYVIDGVPQRLTFRIDDNVARAERINPRKVR
jgi:type IV secretion system protein VirB9